MKKIVYIKMDKIMQDVFSVEYDGITFVNLNYKYLQHAKGVIQH